MNPVFIADAKRTLVSPKNERWRDVSVPALAAPVIGKLASSFNGAPLPIDEVILGNALYAGGNPARLAALEAGLDETVFASTIDTQCCAGLDAIICAVNKVASGFADVIIAGGVESYSRAPIRQHRALLKGGEHTTYNRPPFTPWPDRDPDLLAAAADLAEIHQVSRRDQSIYACESHIKAMASDFGAELVQSDRRDDFTRDLTLSLCDRLPILVGDPLYGLTTATVAVEADAAAAVLVVSERARDFLKLSHVIRVISYRQIGGAADKPILAGLHAAHDLIAKSDAELSVVELMESFAVQAMQWAKALGVPSIKVNRGGGALSRGHPIGASGAILIVRLFHELKKEPSGSKGLAAIAAAGGLGSAMLVEKC